jgi:Flp pilus assembly protein TadD
VVHRLLGYRLSVPRTSRLRPFALGASVLAALACSQYRPFDSEGAVRSKAAERLSSSQSANIRVPFALSEPILEVLRESRPNPNELRRVEWVLDFIFGRLNLRYSLLPTRDAVGTYAAQEGNCLSFVNLFVGIARQRRLNPFYVEVADYQKWSYRDGSVLSQGHIVAGMYVKNELKTYDFLPYRPKSYRSFNPIDDLQATAHFYNNLGAEALLEGNLDRAEEHLRLANQIAPDFVKAVNNLGVLLARRHRTDEAAALYQEGLALAPDDVALLSNLAALYQRAGRAEEAAALLSRMESVHNTNPFFFLYQAEVALANGQNGRAGDLLVEALRLDSEAPEIHLGLVKLYLALGDLERARHHLGRTLKLDATNREALRYAALLAERETQPQ